MTERYDTCETCGCIAGVHTDSCAMDIADRDLGACQACGVCAAFVKRGDDE